MNVYLEMEFELRPIQTSTNVNKLSLGNSAYTPLKIFLKKSAYDFHHKNVAKTYILSERETLSKRAWGYITLMNSEIVLKQDEKPKSISGITNYKVFPAVKIARLAIDKALQGNGFGQGLVDWTAWMVNEKIMPHVGCRFLAVDAKIESVPFYEKLGFNTLTNIPYSSQSSLLMFRDMGESL